MTVEETIALAEARVRVGNGDLTLIRHRTKLSQDAIGRAVGVSRVTVCRWESGQRVPSGDAAGGSDDAALSQDGSLLGTPLYMAPEGMSDPTLVDVRSDIFALGAVGYFLLTGKSPFPGRTAIEVFRMERRGPPPPLSSASPHAVPASLEEVLGRCLAFRREERPDSAEALDALLEACAVEPPWSREDARAWWSDRGPAALAAGRAERVERDQVLSLASDSSARGE